MQTPPLNSHPFLAPLQAQVQVAGETLGSQQFGKWESGGKDPQKRPEQAGKSH